jgi:hypothetical protein
MRRKHRINKRQRGFIDFCVWDWLLGASTFRRVS